jgi:hypothetical protein
MKKVNHRPIESGTIFLSYVFALHWTIPVQDCLMPLVNAYKVGMNTGEIENALWSIFHVLFLSFQAGKPLNALEADFAGYVAPMEERSQRIIADFSKMLWRAVLGLMGQSRDHVQLLDMGEEQSAKPLQQQTLAGFKRIERGYYGDYEQCAEEALKFGNGFQKALPGSPFPPVDMFISALSCFVMTRRTGKSRYKREAKRKSAWITGWVKQGNPNARHWKALLDAEMAALKRQNKAAIKNYELAVELATRGGFIHDAAIANERWGEFALDRLSDRKEAESRLKESLRLCREWGALGKVKNTEEKYSDLLSPSS